MLHYIFGQFRLSSKNVKNELTLHKWLIINSYVRLYGSRTMDDLVVIDSISDAICIAVKDNTVACDLTPKYHEIL